jgi:hypothetical protein
MGLRGPLRSPTSRRGQAEIRKRQKLADNPAPPPPAATESACTPSAPIGKLPTPPKCFTREQAEAYQNLVVDLLAARVPLERVDGHALAMAVRCLAAVEGAEQIANDGESTTEQRLAAYRLMSAYSKDLKDWLQIVCAAPAARARIGLKSAPERKPGPLAQLIAMKQGRKA